MRRFVQKLLLLVAAILAVDLLIPGVRADELALQAGLIGVFGTIMYFRQ
jgi:hypothetical protein